HEIDLLLGLMPMPVGALAACVLRHVPVGDRDLLGADRIGDPAHLARIVAQPVLNVFERDDLVLAHLLPPRRSRPPASENLYLHLAGRAFRAAAAALEDRLLAGGLSTELSTNLSEPEPISAALTNLRTA